MSGDRQDFLERRAARQQRMQQRSGQKAPASRPAQPAGSKPKAPTPAPKTEQKASSTAPAETGRKTTADPDTYKVSKRQVPPPAPDNLEKRSPVGGLVGRRTAARRKKEEVAGFVPPPAGPKPSLLARLILWGTAAICGLLLLATLGEAWTVHRLNQQIAANQQAANQLQAQNQQLSNTVQQLQQPSTIEEEARKLGFIFPGDQPVVIVTSTPPSTHPQKTPAPAQGWWGFWSDWLKLFFGG